jgi:hypothetical protein
VKGELSPFFRSPMSINESWELFAYCRVQSMVEVSIFLFGDPAVGDVRLRRYESLHDAGTRCKKSSEVNRLVMFLLAMFVISIAGCSSHGRILGAAHKADKSR